MCIVLKFWYTDFEVRLSVLMLGSVDMVPRSFGWTGSTKMTACGNV